MVRGNIGFKRRNVELIGDSGGSQMNTWEAIFMQSPVNQGYYDEDELPQQNWEWPKGTWFQARLDQIREHRSPLGLKSSRKMNHGHDTQPM